MAGSVSELMEKVKELEKKLEGYERKEDGKHVWGRSNPLKFPPGCYTLDVAKVNQPLLVFNINKFRPSCCANKQCMKTSTIVHAQRAAFMPRLQDAETIYQKPSGELEVRPWHLSLLEGVKLLTKPSPKPDTGSDSESGTDEETAVAEEIEQDMFIGLGEDDQQALGTGEASASEDDNPSNDGDGGSSSASRYSFCRNDITVRVRDSRAAQFRDTDEHVVVLVIECKVPLREDAIYQALAYAFRRGLDNLMQAGRVAPVHVMAWSDGKWIYGVVDIHGAVELRDGSISDDSYQAFLDHQKVRAEYLKREFVQSPRFTKDKLEKLLSSRTQMLKKSCSLHRDLEYPDKLYLVGDVYIDTHEKHLPHGDSLQTALNQDVYLFYETLLRIVVGRRVKYWSEEDVDQAIALRMDLKKRRLDAVVPEDAAHMESDRKRMRL